MDDDNKPRGRVTGIGGLFFKVADTGRTKAWYQQHLGLSTDEWGTTFEWRQADNVDAKGYTQWSPFKADTDYFDPSEKEFMVNYRVVHIEALLAQLRAGGVTIISEIQEFDYGKFAQVMDPDGLKLELWEPNDDEYEKILGVITR